MLADRLDRILDPHRGDRRKRVADGFQEPDLLRNGAAAGIGQRGNVGVRRAGKSARREHQHEIDAQVFPLDGAQVGDAGLDVAAEHVDHDRIADLEIEAVGDLLLERDERRPLGVGGPPASLDHGRAARHVGRERDAAIALQHPGRVRLRLDVVGLDAVRRHDAAAQHRNALELRVRSLLADEGVETLRVRGLNVEEVERRRLVRQRAFHLPPEISVDLDDRHEQRETEPERQHDRRRQRARPVHVGDREPQRHHPRMGQPAGDRHQQQRDGLKRCEHRSGGADEHRPRSCRRRRGTPQGPQAPQPQASWQ